MSDDIVTRLRDLREMLMGNPIMAREVQEAMDEIERLRLDAYRWRRVADVCVIALGVPENYTDRLAVELYDKAVRGE